MSFRGENLNKTAPVNFGKILIRLGLLLTGLAIQGAVLKHTILDEGRVADASVATLKNERLQTWMQETLSEQGRPSNGLDPATVTTLVSKLPSNPEFQDAFRTTVRTIHHQIFSQSPKGFSAESRAELSRGIQDAATGMGIPAEDVAQLQLPFDTLDLPNVGTVTKVLNTALPILAGLGLAALLVGVAIHRNPRQGARKVGIGLIWNVVPPLIPFVIVPWIMEKRAINAFTAPATQVIHELGRDVILPIGGVVTIGLILIAVTYLIPEASTPKPGGWRRVEEM